MIITQKSKSNDERQSQEKTNIICVYSNNTPIYRNKIEIANTQFALKRRLSLKLIEGKT